MTVQRNAAIVLGLWMGSLGLPVMGDLIIEETFTGYPDNALISASPAGSAIGLEGDWTLTPKERDFFVNKTAADDNAGTGKAVYDMPPDDNGARQAKRATSSQHVLYENAGDLFYASFLIDPALASGDMTFELELKNLAGGGDRNFSFGIIDGDYIVGNGGSSVETRGGSVTANEQLVLARIEYGTDVGGSSGDETVTLWVDPVDESSTPVIDGTTVDLLNQGGGKIMSVTMRGQGMLGQPAFFDDLRVGTSFQSVVPEPSALSLCALGSLLLFPLIRRRL